MPFAKDGTAVTDAAAAADGGQVGRGAAAGGGLDIMGLAKTAAAVIGLLLLASCRPQVAARPPDRPREGPARAAQARPGAGLRARPGGAATPLRQLEGQRKTPIEAQMEDLAMRKPDDVAQLLRGWLVERR